MLFWLCLIILIVGIGLVVVGKMEWFDTRNENKLRKFLYQNDDTIEYSGYFQGNTWYLLSSFNGRCGFGYRYFLKASC